MDAGSVTTWLRALSSGQGEVAQNLWERYFARMVVLARNKLRASASRAADEEDIALSAFHSFFRAASEKRFPRLANRDDLWQVLVVLTARKAIDQRKYETRQKRADTATRPLDDAAIDTIVGTDPDPAFAAMVADEFRVLLEKLGDEQLRQIAVRKLEGFTNDEIAADLGCTVRTVGRRLALIRDLWEGSSSEGTENSDESR
ncbi:MAG: RNA polymerase subunit sigma-70 [Planctomycetia bacterium]|nr:RNA polymerase subunit sigma-70 [Planctomycetia bacterium]